MVAFRYALLVFLGACSYGAVSTMMKLGIQAGFTVQQLIGGQYVFGWLLLLVLTGLFSRHKMGLKHVLLLLGCGLSVCFTSITYGVAVAELPASIAVVFLFQFTWIGILLDAIVSRRRPDNGQIGAVAILLVGTVLAGGLLEQGISGLTWKGALFGILSAVSFALYIFVSGRAAVTVPVLNRSLTMITSAMLVVFILFPPTFIWDGALLSGLWKYGLAIGLLGIVIPVIFFGIGIPRIGTSLGTILGAAELPAAVIVSVIILQEQVTGLQWLGIVLIFIGICVPQIAVAVRQRRSTKMTTNQEQT
ncbi:EamA family transporter [Paenibacillus sp. 481]|uniref:EamA family transporter n=1 Tax=Paenibacillus sp. 481 TaxID=2835869 RepID=UPI001E4D3987|nr:DMT family transporter [Paenibacillus sp. 481]UHA72387.1 EamA family transporter [Paenibacillus sp. 481]